MAISPVPVAGNDTIGKSRITAMRARASGRRGRDARGPASRPRESRAFPPRSSRRRCGHGRPAGRSDRSRIQPSRGAERQGSRPPGPRRFRPRHPASASASTLMKAARHGGGAARALSSLSTRAMAAPKSLGRARPSAPNRRPARRRAPRRKARNCRQAPRAPSRARRLRAFSTALSRKVDPVSSGSIEAERARRRPARRRRV